MKFPLEARPFAPLQLTREQRDGFARTAMELVLEAVDEFDQFVHREHRTLDPTLWKPVKTREHVTVYKKRELEEMVLADVSRFSTMAPLSSPETTSHDNHSHSHSSGSLGSNSVSAIANWSMPKLLGVGSIVGDFDDVMYGVISPDLDSIQVKTTYVDDELVDSDILAVVQRGTVEDPYRFIGLKWFVKSTPSANLVRPRDLTFIEATGVYVNAQGERYGYHAMHSVELPEMPSLDHLGIVRGTFSSCFLFKPLPNRSVEVYMKSFVEVAGNLPIVVGIMSATNGLMGFWKSVYAAERKKLAWLVRHSGHAKAPRREKTDGDGHASCALCDRKFSPFRGTPKSCTLCHAVVCSRCESARKLTFVESGVVHKRSLTFCKTCIMRATTMNAAPFARNEHVIEDVPVRHVGVKDAMDAKHAIDGMATPPPRPVARRTRVATEPTMDAIVASAGGRTASAPDHRGRLNALVDARPRRVVAPSGRTMEVPEETALVAVRPPSQPTAKSTAATMPPQQQQQQQQELWTRMQQLRLQAEQAYRLTAQNNHAMAEVSSRARRPTRESIL